MAFLLTWHGTLLCRHRHSGMLVHRPVATAAEDVAPAVLDLPIEQLQPAFGHHLREARPDLPPSLPGEFRQFSLRWAEDRRTVSLYQDDALLSAAPDGDRVASLQAAPGGWETFLPISATDLDALRVILNTSWLIRSSGVLMDRSTMGPLFHLHVGDLAADLRFQLPFDLAARPDRLTLLA